MCFPLLAIAAVGSLALGVAGTVMSADAAKKQAQSQKDQLAIQAAANAQNAALAKQNEDLALSAAKTNSDSLLAITKENNDQLLSVTNANNKQLLGVTAANNKQLLDITAQNATARQQITDINVGLATSISNFNDQVADGNAKMLLGRGELEAAASESNASTARLNAGYQEQAAQDAQDASHKEEQDSRLNYARLKSTQRATLAANGVALDEGSALRIQTDTDYFSDVDGATIHANGIRAAMGYRQQETNDLIQAGQAEIGAKVARLNAATDAAQVQAQAAGARIGAMRDIENMKLSTSFDILQAQEAADIQTQRDTNDAAMKTANASSDAAIRIANNTANANIASANILNEGRKEATQYEMQASGFQGAADSETAQGSGINPGAAGMQALIGGAASVAGKWFTYQQSGVFG